jgi:type I restriction enzyme M protein
MVQVVRPKPGERVYDPCFGTAGFLGEAAEFVRQNGKLNAKHLEALQNHCCPI